MSEASLTLIIAILSSPLWVPAFDYVRSRVWAKLNFHGWQAVFLHTPEGTTTYFGHVTSVSKNDLTLEDIYYLKDSSKVTPENINFLIGPELVKLGEGQLHLPEDKMIINRQFVVFMENMTSEAPVMKMIFRNEAKKRT
jgi:hypothetical protein